MAHRDGLAKELVDGTGIIVKHAGAASNSLRELAIVLPPLRVSTAAMAFKVAANGIGDVFRMRPRSNGIIFGHGP